VERRHARREVARREQTVPIGLEKSSHDFNRFVGWLILALGNPSSRPDHETTYMIAPDLETSIDGLQEIFDRATVIVPFTGAGISTECGIPDFRSPGGIWTKNQPIPFDVFLASREMRDEAWRRRFAMEEQFSQAKPGRGHLALASLYRAGKSPGVVTQNIDNLHQASGIAHEHVVELHGNTSYASCLDCARRYELAWVKQRFEASGHAPDCPDCDGPIKTATVSFGQAMPEAAMRRAEELTRACDVFLTIGSSLVVWPAAGFPLMAKRNGAHLVIINREPTDFDDVADLVIRQDIGAVLSSFIAH
jgi:NAD-dependent deacetylase